MAEQLLDLGGNIQPAKQMLKASRSHLFPRGQSTVMDHAEQVEYFLELGDSRFMYSLQDWLHYAWATSMRKISCSIY